MRKSGFLVLLALLLVVLLGIYTGAQAETKKFSGASEAIKWIRKNQPEELTVEGKFKPADLLKVKNAMPEGSEFHFRKRGASGRSSFSSSPAKSSATRDKNQPSQTLSPCTPSSASFQSPLPISGSPCSPKPRRMQRSSAAAAC